MAKQVTMSAAEFRALMAKGGRSKYRNVKVTGTPDGDFDSGHEYRQWLGLKDDEKAGRVRNLRRQVPYALEINGQKVCEYVADFVYEQASDPGTEFPFWRSWTVVADAKGYRTAIYRLKKKLMKACLGIEVKEL